MLKDEYNRLITMFHDAAAGKNLNLEEVFKMSLEFFEHLKEQIAHGSVEDKQEAMKMMAELYSQMMAESKKIAERSGMTEEQLMNYAENPANFTKEQWNAIQASKERIASAGKGLAKTVEESTKRLHGKGHPPKMDKKPPHDPGDKSKWLRS